MQSVIEPLVIDLVLWCAGATRSYDDVLDAWRTSCPRLMVWEDAVARGLLETWPGASGLIVVVTSRGMAYLAVCGAMPGARLPVAPRVACVVAPI